MKLLIGFVAIVIISSSVYLLYPGKKSTSQTPSNTSYEQATGPSFSFDPASIKLASGKQTTVNIKLDTANTPVAAATISLSYDATKVKIISLKNGTLLNNVLSPGKIKDSVATLSVATPPSAAGQTESGVVASVVIESISDSPSMITFGSDSMVVSLAQDGNVLKTLGQLKVN